MIRIVEKFLEKITSINYFILFEQKDGIFLIGISEEMASLASKSLFFVSPDTVQREN